MEDQNQRLFRKLKEGVIAPKELVAFLKDEEPSVHQVQEILAGRTKTKPKILPSTDKGKFYRYISGKGYEEFVVDPIPLHLMELDTKGLEKYRTGTKKDKPTIPGCEVRSLSFFDEPDHQRIPPQAFYELMTFIGRDSRWWPFDDAAYDYYKNFSDNDVEIRGLYRDNKPVGVAIWDEREPKDRVTINYFGLIPSERGKGSGGKFFDWTIGDILEHSRELEIMSIQLLTTEVDKLSPKPGQEEAPSAMNLYENRGFNTIKKVEVKSPYEIIEAGEFLEQARAFLGVPKDFYKSERYSDKEMNLRLTRALGSFDYAIKPPSF